MSFFTHIHRVLLVALGLLAGCKASQPKADATPQAEAPAVNAQFSANGMDNMLRVPGTIRYDLETYFEEYSQLALGDEEKREDYLQKGLAYFQNASTPILIIVNQVDGKNTYDKPTNIEKYLDYLKHTRQSPHTINNFELDEEGRITKLELTLKQR
ncbi:MAG: hypothetical protein MJA30_18920 [Cytophagales bacterium]|nr:hypothetical protein [Cytophagales bacterium]